MKNKKEKVEVNLDKTLNTTIFFSKNKVLNTNGNGYWSVAKKKVIVTKARIIFFDNKCDIGELRVFFDINSWSTIEDGLIYTDRRFLKELRQVFVELGMSEKAVKALDYSEQGMQGDDYVSLDITEPFIKSYMNLIDIPQPQKGP